MAMHCGVYYDETRPTTGVVNANVVEWLAEERMRGTNLSYEEATQEFRAEFARERGLADEDVEEHDAFEREFQAWADQYEEQGDTYLIGSWRKNADGKYTPDPEADGAEYAAIVREFVVQVLWSKRVVRVRSLCSPCYPGQADLDSGETEDGILAFALPLDVMGDTIRTENEAFERARRTELVLPDEEAAGYE